MAALDLSKMETPTSVDEFRALTERIREQPHFRDPVLWAIGVQILTAGSKKILASAHFPHVNGPGQSLGAHAVIANALGISAPQDVECRTMTFEDLHHARQVFKSYEFDDIEKHPNMRVLKDAQSFQIQVPRPVAQVVFVAIYDAAASVQTVEDGTLRLYGMSHRHFRPNNISFDGLFGTLPNVAWAGRTPVGLEDVARMNFDLASDFTPDSVDKFPLYAHRMAAFALEHGIRILDTKRVRLGAHLGDGTVVMPGASYVNFNAGTAGKSMVEGRISSGVFIGEGTDVGGGASIIGVLSGGNKTPITVGRNCLLGANSTLGISIGDAVVLQGGVALEPGMLVQRLADDGTPHGNPRKLRDLQNIEGVTFYVNSQNGQLVMRTLPENKKRLAEIEAGTSSLNPLLHSTPSVPVPAA